MKLGQYELDQIYTGDCAEVMATWPDECIDLTVTSPPYDNLRTYNGYSFDFEEIARQLYRVTKRGGVVVWVIGDSTTEFSESLESFRQAIYFRDLGFCIETMIYEKDCATWNESSRRYKPEFEYMFAMSKGAPRIFNPISDLKTRHIRERKVMAQRNRIPRYEIAHPNLYKVRGNIWYYVTGSSQTYGNHPAPFPESLARDHILSWSNPGDVVLDPMCGSGTTLFVSKELGRHWLGIDISEEYCEMSQKRVDGARIPLVIPETVSVIQLEQAKIVFSYTEGAK